MLRVKDLVVAYGDLPVLHQIKLEVNRGEVVSVLGANGAGKTTLLQAISGLLPARAGTINFLDHDISRIPAYELPGLGLAHVPQGRGIFATLTVLDNLLVGSWNPQARKKREENIARVYELFPRLKERSRQLAGTLSGGEQQMLALGRALTQEPNLLMLDEPSLGLAPVLADSLFETLENIKKQGISILLVEQNVFYATELANRCYLLESGRVTLEGSSEEFQENPKIKESYLGM
ncbi:MAG: ABC transporter ATP-binding protein [Deltaproteobacteria bacterium]|nr:ABC transporter ATP-binding protein [Deltaproteobacteria bacterium]